jgi:hypothetical protein
MGGFALSPFFNTSQVKNCDEIVLMTQLFSPAPIVIAKIKSGNKLDIELLGEHGPCVAVYHGEVAGTIITKNLYQLISCIRKGTRFIGIVRNATGGSCSITIQSNKG